MEKRHPNVVYAEFEEWGEKLVREKFELGHFGSGTDGKHNLARIWLSQKDQERIEESNSLSRATARSAKNAAWAAAIAAIIAAIAATVSAVMLFRN
ncbi:hypothetical protein [Parasphingorhabdus sp.]|uniref:hypothetical protein n=1 Tax=Parasphingorhabdus sp. TaxID=2709688 RepID=UPI00359416BE